MLPEWFVTAVKLYTGRRACFLAAMLQYGDKSRLSATTSMGVMSCRHERILLRPSYIAGFFAARLYATEHEQPYDHYSITGTYVQANITYRPNGYDILRCKQLPTATELASGCMLCRNVPPVAQFLIAAQYCISLCTVCTDDSLRIQHIGHARKELQVQQALLLCQNHTLTFWNMCLALICTECWRHLSNL